MTELQKSIETLYKTFERYPRPISIEACPCGCTKPGATDPLVASSLRELHFADMADFSSSAMTTQGSINDFRYLLPRLFQGITEEEYAYNPEILFGKLEYAKWMTWPEDEIASIKKYLSALWLEGLNNFPINERFPGFYEIETLLTCIAVTRVSLEPYLQQWTDLKIKTADEHLIQFVTMYGEDFSDGRTFQEAFWTKSPTQANALRTWLLSPETIHRIQASAYLLRVDGFEHLFEPAFAVLRDESKTSKVFQYAPREP
jgi:hypothetical protein